MSQQDIQEPISSLSIGPKSVEYCGICTAPYEYCPFSPKPNNCKAWLLENNPAAYLKYYGEVGDVSELQTNKPTESKPKKEPKIIITSIERTKRKRITQIRGLDHFTPLKAAAKLFSNKFAASASVAKLQDGSGNEEILIQGDCAFELMEFIIQEYQNVTSKDVEIAEPKKKK